MGREVIDVYNQAQKASEHTLEKQGDKFLISPKLTIRILSFDPLFLTHVTLMMFQAPDPKQQVWVYYLMVTEQCPAFRYPPPAGFYASYCLFQRLHINRF